MITAFRRREGSKHARTQLIVPCQFEFNNVYVSERVARVRVKRRRRQPRNRIKRVFFGNDERWPAAGADSKTLCVLRAGVGFD